MHVDEESDIARMSQRLPMDAMSLEGNVEINAHQQ
jgi:hypothetical protein